ncbi:15107_t:CDS:1, partial [Racocetra fulgida]
MEIYVKYVGVMKNNLQKDWYNDLGDNGHNSRVTNFFGVTQDPQIRDFMLVIDFVRDGNLHQFLLNHNELNSTKMQPGRPPLSA